MSWSWLPISSLVTRSALSRPATRLYPLERRTPYQRTRGHIHFRIDNCNFCTVCAHKCPTAAIVANKTDKTWAIDHRLCILCGNCVEDCREGCITLSNDPYPPMTAVDVRRFREEYAAPPPPAEGVAVPPPEETSPKA